MMKRYLEMSLKICNFIVEFSSTIHLQLATSRNNILLKFQNNEAKLLRNVNILHLDFSFLTPL